MKLAIQSELECLEGEEVGAAEDELRALADEKWMKLHLLRTGGNTALHEAAVGAQIESLATLLALKADDSITNAEEILAKSMIKHHQWPTTAHLERKKQTLQTQKMSAAFRARFASKPSASNSSSRYSANQAGASPTNEARSASQISMLVGSAPDADVDAVLSYQGATSQKSADWFKDYGPVAPKYPLLVHSIHSCDLEELQQVSLLLFLRSCCSMPLCLMLVQILAGFVHDDIATVKEELEEHVKERWQKLEEQKVATMLVYWLMKTDYNGPHLRIDNTSLLPVCSDREAG